MSEPEGIDGVACILNPVQATDLRMVLSLTPAERRIDVALAFVGLTVQVWATKAGFSDARTAWRWISRENRLPLGGAYRLATVLGVDALQLFAGYME